MYSRIGIVLALCLGVMLSATAAKSDYTLLKEAGIEKPARITYNYLAGELDKAREKWLADYETRLTPEAIAEHNAALRSTYLEMLGELPERTPLNPQVTGIIQREGYRVEKILYESQPKHYVSALLFVPENSKHAAPYPGVLVPCGHAANAKAYESYQSMGALLALNEMVALVFDPIDQGERAQYLDENGNAPIWGTKAHTMVGVGSMLLGRNTLTYELWDAMRGIDYLQSRPEVDPERIGITGNSGGGTQTAYLIPLDDRIDAAAPSCFVHHQYRQITTEPGDAEQNVYGQMIWGMDHADMITMRAPELKVKLLAATKDFFQIDAVWETFRHAKRVYSRLGYSERIDLLENDAEHNYNKIQREAGARWLARWLLGNDTAIVEPELDLLTNKEAWCTPNGKTLLLEGSRSVYDLNRELEAKYAKQREIIWKKEKQASLLNKVRESINARELKSLPEYEARVLRTEKQDKVKVDYLVLSTAEGITLPALYMEPAKSKQAPVTVLLCDKGLARSGKYRDELLEKGHCVFSVDVRLTGEAKWNSEDRMEIFLPYVLGKSYVGMRAEDIWMATQYARERSGQKQVHLKSIGFVGVPALHAAALESDLYVSVEIEEALVSWHNVVEQGMVKNQWHNAVHGALTYYDLPQLAETLGEKITIENPVDANGKH